MQVRTLAGLIVGALLLSGCSAKTGSESSPETGAEYLSSAPLEGAQGVAEAKKAASDGEEITLVGRIGGSEKPFVENLAAFTIVDPAIEHCAADEGCPTPWDYCCETDKLADNSAAIKLVDANGKTLAGDAKKLLGVEELSLVTIRGTANRDAEGNLTVTAHKVHVAEKNGD
jgi:hypothetical protein